ncbi:molybdopterin-guanine dinucleotide biosynthesis protein B [Natrarchaeobius oligotrophus]|uniref:Molybdopterin-guanine dinucleotide biosynthesis protein B n=1 Tax=Natrarchaeobius chitinivorans TaxID=1679083 RepID=A0A3N6MBM4_NATCH|nr:molybdopterin-guanine dinucleotide biosynthesis protein B [Natrarchaeobius chitinivorans]RQH00008.1 molybdopterin-guanine dinucleotide biosynthesis protein B [Natrarchaeobius chitinivorans]
MKVVSLAGPSDAGKTTLVEALVPRLTDRGRRVATVKSIHHAVEIDTPGTDTHRHRTAGAEAVVGVTPDVTFEITGRGKRDPPDGESGVDPDSLRDPGFDGDADRRERRALASTLARLERRGYDVVLVEGFAAASLPTILVGDRDRSAVGGTVVARGDDDVDDLVETIEDLESRSVLRSEPRESERGDRPNPGTAGRGTGLDSKSSP